MGEWQDKIEGKLKQGEGELTDDELRERQGEGQELVGEARGKLDDVKDEAEKRF